MATKPIPKGSKNLTVNVSQELHADVKALAEKSEMSLGAYVRALLEDARRSDSVFSLRLVRKDRPANLTALPESPQLPTLPREFEVAAGAQLSGPAPGGEVSVPEIYADGKHHVLSVCGASMEPLVPDGADIIVCDYTGTGKYGKIYVTRDSDGSSLKRKIKGPDGPVFESVNEDYPELAPADDLRITGQLVAVIEEDGSMRTV